MVLPHSPFLSVFAILLFALPAVWGTWEALKGKKAAGSIIGAILFSTAFEYIAVKTGFPYGYFFYGDVLLPKIMNAVPLLVGVAWLPVFLGASALARRAGVGDGVPFMLTVALLMLAADFVIDPGAVAEGLWLFRNGGEYFGVPVGNFVGWLFMGSLAATLLPIPGKSEKAVAGFALMIMFWSVIDLLNGLVIPAMTGLIFLAAISWFDLKRHGWQRN